MEAQNISDVDCVRIALDAACMALETAINTVECASIDVKTGEELPWYKQAHNALVLAGRPWDSIRRLPMTDNRFQKEVHDFRARDLFAAIEKCLTYQAQGVNCVVVDIAKTEMDRYGLMLKSAAEFAGLPILTAGLTGERK